MNTGHHVVALVLISPDTFTLLRKELRRPWNDVVLYLIALFILTSKHSVKHLN